MLNIYEYRVNLHNTIMIQCYNLLRGILLGSMTPQAVVCVLHVILKICIFLLEAEMHTLAILARTSVNVRYAKVDMSYASESKLTLISPIHTQL